MSEPVRRRSGLVEIAEEANLPLRWEFPGNTTRRTVLGFAVPALLAATATVTVDAPAARARWLEEWPGELVSLVNHGEVFGDGLGALVILAGVWFLDPARRRCLPRLLAATFGAGAAANVVKACLGRPRPFQWLAQGGVGAPWSWDGSWFPFGANGTALQSFPSGHTATAVGLALGLAALYPQGRCYFAALAALVAVQRVMTDMHYVSDVLAGAAAAWLVAAALFRIRAIDARFQRFERGPKPPSATSPVRSAA